VQCANPNLVDTRPSITIKMATAQTIKLVIVKHFAAIVIQSRQEQN